MIFRRHGTPGRGTATVSIRVRDLAQLFNSLDPSPFWDRDLDPAAAEFIEDEFREKLSAHTWHLHVHALESPELAADLQPAIEHYYERLAASARRKLRDNLRAAELALLAGLSIFLVCMMARQVLANLMQSVPRVLDEGLIVIAWVALWRPTEALAYEWVPLYRKRRLYQRLAAVRVTVRCGVAPAQITGSVPQTSNTGSPPRPAPQAERPVA